MKRILVAGLAVAALAAALWLHYPPFRLLALAATGHSPVCPLGMALQSTANEREQIAAKDRILRASHFVKRDGALELWQTPAGGFWIPAGNRYVLPFNLAEMERHVYGQGEHFIHPGDIVLDCGASDGDFSRVALAAGAGLVVAIEVAPTNIECLRRNLAGPIAAGKAIVYPKGVWNRDAELPLSVEEQNFAANSVVLHPSGSKTAGTAPLTTIDHIAAELHLARVDFIKMDIEGAEIPALAGAADVIARFHPRLAITTEHHPADEFDIPAAVRARWSGYHMACGPCLEEHGHIRPDVLYFF